MTARPASLKRQASSGGVVYRRQEGRVEVILVSVREGRYWCLPKGLIDQGETAEQAALREVREESGLTGRIVEDLGEISYWYYIKGENTKCRKTVHFFLMEYVSGSTAQHDLEVDEAKWFPVDEALGKISFKGDRSILQKAAASIGDAH